MKLIDYVIQNQDQFDLKKYAKRFDYKDEYEYVLTEFCPSIFNCLKDTPYVKPYSPVKDNKAFCKYSGNYTGEEGDNCNKCWNREVLVTDKKGESI